MKEIIIIITLLILFSTSLSAGQYERPDLGLGFKNSGIFNLNNLRMNHSISFMSGFSSGGKGFYQSTYTNHLSYRFNPKLDLNIDLNFVNFGTADWSKNYSLSANNDNANRVIPEFSLNYKPTDNTRITIEYRQAIPHNSSYHNWRW